MTTNRLALGLGCALALGGCGSSVIDISGTLTATIHNPGSADLMVQPWNADEMVLDAPPGLGNDFFGTCDFGANTWSADLNQSNSANGVSEVVLSQQDRDASVQAEITAIGVTYTGSCVNAPDTWSNSHDYGVVLDCTALTALGDPRTLDVGSAMMVTNCTGQ